MAILAALFFAIYCPSAERLAGAHGTFAESRLKTTGLTPRRQFVCVCMRVVVCAQSFAETSPQLSRQLGTASMTLSLAGIAVSLLTVVIVVSSGRFHVPMHNFTADGNGTLDDNVIIHITTTSGYGGKLEVWEL